MPAAFALRGVGVRFDDRDALADVTLSVAPGDALAFVGPSGAGKTTLLRLLAGLARPTAGTVAVDGEDLSRLGPGELRRVRSRIGFVHQDLALVPNLRVVQNVLAGGLGRRGFWGGMRSVLLPERDALERVHELLERVGIADRLYERTDALSGGERQRVAIARALYQEPRALLADEPVSSLDPARSRDVLELLLAISGERGLTLVLSMHDLGLARSHVPRLVGLRAGRVVFDGSRESVDGAELERLFELEGGEGGGRAG